MTTHASATHPETGGPSRRTVRRAGLALLGLVAVVLGLVLTGPVDEGLPLDPRSAEGDGLLGVMRLLDSFGVEVEISTQIPADPDGRVFVPADQMPDDRREQLRRFAEAGGTVVVAGPSPSLHDLVLEPGSFIGEIGRTGRMPECAELEHVGVVLQADWTAFEVPDGATACFPTGPDTAWLVVVPTGQGAVVAIGSAEPLTNAALDDEDNAVLAATLLGPDPGSRLVVVPRGEVGEGQVPLLDLVPPGVIRALWLAAAAVLAAVVWRARRLGPPVAEHLPPVLPSAELARSVAGLLQRAGDREAAARRIQEDLRREVARVLRVPVTTPSERLVQLVPQRSRVTEREAGLALLDGRVTDDAGLTALAAAAARVRSGLARGATGVPEDPDVRATWRAP